MIQQSIEGQGLPNDFLSLVHLTADREERLSSQFMGDLWPVGYAPSCYWFSRLELQWLPKFLMIWVGYDPIQWPKIPPSATFRSMILKQHANLNPKLQGWD